MQTVSTTTSMQINIYSTTGEHAPSNLISTTEIPNNHPLQHLGYCFIYTLPKANLQSIFNDYLAAFESFITENLTKYQGFGDDEYYDYLPDYIEQLIQISTYLNKPDTPNKILSIIKQAEKQFNFDFTELIDCFDWDQIYTRELDTINKYN